MKSKIVIFSQFAYQENILANYLYDYFDDLGVQLILIGFDNWDSNLSQLKLDYLDLKSMSLLNVLVDKKIPDKLLNDDFVQNILYIEKQIYNRDEIDEQYFEMQANSFYWMIMKLLKSLNPIKVILLVVSTPVTEIIKYCIDQHKLQKLFLWKWVYLDTYQFNNISAFNKDGRIHNNNIRYELEKVTYLKNQIVKKKQKYYKYSEKNEGLDEDNYILFLGAKLSFTTGCKYTKEYYQLGLSWGNDTDCLKKIENVFEQSFPDTKLLFRQHPFEKPKITNTDISRENTMLANDADLFYLIKNAVAVICMQTNLIYITLLLNKATCVLGRFEIENDEYLPVMKNSEDLKNWLHSVINNERYSMSEDLKVKVENDINNHIMNNVILMSDIEHNKQVLRNYVTINKDERKSSLHYFRKLKLKLWLKERYYSFLK